MANVYLAVILLSCLSIFTTLAGVMLALKVPRQRARYRNRYRFFRRHYAGYFLC